MKNLIYYISVSFILFSCASENKAINSYLKEETKTNEKNKNLVLIKEKILTQYVLKKIQKRFIKKNEKTNYNDTINVFFNDDELEYLNKKYKNDTVQENWFKKDIKDFNFVILSAKNELKEIKEYNFNLGNRPFSFYIYNISKPFFTTDKKTCFFYLSKSILLSEDCNDCNIHIMEKQKNKWVLKKSIPVR